MTRLIFFIFFSTLLWAQPILELSQFQELKYYSASDKPLQISNETKRIIISFDQEGNNIMSAFLQTKPTSYLPSNQTIYIGDISQMPSIVTRLFAKPRMAEYPFTIYLHDEEKLASLAPHEPNKLTVILFDEQNQSSNIFFTNNPQEAMTKK